MKHPSYEPNCPICAAGARPPEELIFENDLWVVRPGDGIPGDILVQTQRHSPAIATFNDAEAANFGPALRHFCRVQLELTGALRIYMSVIAENFPHFHTHLIPKYAVMPQDATTTDVFKLAGLIRSGKVAVDTDEVKRTEAALRQALKESPPPSSEN